MDVNLYCCILSHGSCWKLSCQPQAAPVAGARFWWVSCQWKHIPDTLSCETVPDTHQYGVKDLVVLPWVCQKFKQQVGWHLVSGLQVHCSSGTISLQEGNKQHMREL